jgi:ABC-2 type transport system permease protein
MNNVNVGFRITYKAFKNELKEIINDKGALLILFFAVIAYPIVYSIGYKNNVLREIPIAVIDLDHTQSSRTLTRMIDQTQQVKVYTKANSLTEAERLFWEGNINGIILIESEFEKKLFKGEQSNIDVYCDAGYFLIYKETLNAALKSSGTFSAGVEIKRNLASGSSFEQAIEQQHPLDLKFTNLYNPSGAYGSFVMPGIIILIIQQTLLIGIGMIGGAGREKNNKQFIAPGIMLRSGAVSVITGKALAYFLIYMVNAIITLVWMYDWFDFPDKGNLFHMFLLLVPFLFSVIFMGLTISLLFTKREYSIIFLVFLSPIVLFLSGLSWPANSIPKFLHTIAYIFPSTNMVPAYIRLRTMGVGIQDIQSEFFILITQMTVYFVLACVCYKYFAKKHSIKENNIHVD